MDMAASDDDDAARPPTTKEPGLKRGSRGVTSKLYVEKSSDEEDAEEGGVESYPLEGKYVDEAERARYVGSEGRSAQAMPLI